MVSETEMLDLARDVAHHPRFRWTAGMRASWVTPAAKTPWGRVYARPGGFSWQGEGPGGGFLASWPDPWEGLPDLTDAATAGCLLAMAIEDSRLLNGHRVVGLSAEGTPGEPDLFYGNGVRAESLGEFAARGLLQWWQLLDERDPPSRGTVSPEG